MKLHVPIRQRLKVIGLIFLMGMSCGVLLGQNPLVKQWDYRFGGNHNDKLYELHQTSDGGYILGGWSVSDNSGNKTQPHWGPSPKADYWIVKIDSDGTKQWDKRYGGTEEDEFSTLQQTEDGGYILGGSSKSGISGDKTQTSWGSYEDYWIIKIDSLGIKEWDKRFGGSGTDILTALDRTDDGGYVLGGYSHSDSSGDKTQPSWGTYDYWIVKVDSTGNKEWDRRYGTTSSDYLHALQQTTDGGYIFGGVAGSGISGDKTQLSWGSDDYWIVKIDSTGTKLWDKRFGGTSYDELFSIQETLDSGFILGGFSQSQINGDKTQPTWSLSTDYWIVKIDSVGNKLWDKDFGGSGQEIEFGKVLQTMDGGFLLSGLSLSPLSGDKSQNNQGHGQSWIVKTDALGNKQWDRTLLTNCGTWNDGTGFAIQTTDGCYAMANWSYAGIGGDKTQPNWNSYITQPSADYWMIKFCDPTLSLAPAIYLMSSDSSFCEKHCVDFYDISFGNPTSWQWLFPGADSSTSSLQNPTNICYNQYGSFDVTLIACNTFGCDTLVLTNFINAYQTPVPTVTQSNDTLFASSGVAYQWWGLINGIITIGGNNSYYIPTQPGSYYVIVTDTTGCEGASNTIVIMGINEEARSKGQMAIVPNPNDGSFTIKLNENIGKDFSLRIINSLGQTIECKQKAIVNGQSLIVILNPAKGFYTLELTTNEKVYRQKFVVATLPN